MAFGESLGSTVAVYGLIGAAVVGANYGVAAIVDSQYGGGNAVDYVEQSGYTDPQLLDSDYLLMGFPGCGQDESVSYEFEATAPNGARVGVLVCKGLFKGATLRQG